MSRRMEPAPLAFTFEGTEIPAEPGDTLAAALLRAGVTTFSRSAKYHRPRGPFCLAGNCAQCHMRVGGEPNVPTCETAVTPGVQVERQNVLGTGDTDLLRAVDFLFPEKLDHHHLMTGLKPLSAATQAIARRLAGIGEKPDVPRAIAEAEVAEASTVIIGGGRAGLAAAGRTGKGTVLLEQRSELGGRAREGYVPRAETSIPADVEVRLNTRAIGLFEEGGARYVLARSGERLLRLRTEEVVLATGGTERNLPFEQNDLPGVFGGRGLLRLVREHRVKPAKKVAVLAASPDALVVARGLVAEGLELAAVLDPLGLFAGVDLPVIRAEAVRAVGRTKVSALLVREGNAERKIACDAIAVVAPLQPSYELAAEVGAEARFHSDAGGFLLTTDLNGRTTIPWVRAVGLVASGAR